MDELISLFKEEIKKGFEPTSAWDRALERYAHMILAGEATVTNGDAEFIKETSDIII